VQRVIRGHVGERGLETDQHAQMERAPTGQRRRITRAPSTGIMLVGAALLIFVSQPSCGERGC